MFMGGFGGACLSVSVSFVSFGVHIHNMAKKKSNWLVAEVRKAKRSQRRREAYEQRKKSGPVVYLNPKTYEVQEKALTKVRAMYIASAEFLKSYEWRSKRMEAIKLHGARCQCCGATPKDGVRINVDHIQPRKTHPELALDLNNLQVLCEECNHGKGNWDNTDWRE